MANRIVVECTYQKRATAKTARFGRVSLGKRNEKRNQRRLGAIESIGKWQG